MDDLYNFHDNDSVTVQQFVSDEVKAMAAPHWLSFPPSHPFFADFTAIFFAILSFFVLFANGFIIFLFMKESSIRTPSNLFILNLSISDFMMMLTVGVPIAFNPIFGNYWAYGSLFCTIYGFAGGVFGVISIWTMVFIGYDRYHNITHKYKVPAFTFLQAFFALSFVWIYAIGVNLPPALGVWGRFSLEGLLITCAFEYCIDTVDNVSYVICAFFACYVVPLLYIFYFYFFIVKTVSKFYKAMRSSKTPYMALAYTGKISTEAKINRLAVTSVLLWILAWTPYAIVVLTAQFGPRHLITPLVSQIPSLSAKTFTVFNCVTFGFSHPNIQKVAKKNLPCIFGGTKNKNNNEA